MRKLLYLFLTCLLLAGCRDNRYYLDKVEALWGGDYDSVQHYLLKVDSASLTQEDALDYHYFRMKASYAYLMAMEKSRLDSMIGTMRERYPKGHERAFDARFLQLVYYYNRLDDRKRADDLADESREYIRNKRDSSRWYRYKYLLKFYQDDADSALHYLNEAAKYRLFSEARIYALHGDLCQAKQQGDSAAWYYLKAMELDSIIPMFQLANLVLDFLPQQKDSKKALELLARLRDRIKRADIPYYNMIKILDGYDKFVKIKKDDTVFLATPIYEGREKTFYKLLDRIAMCGAKSVILSPKKYLSHHASSEDLMMMLDLMKPKYYFPIKGEYSELVSNGDLAYKLGIPKENIILKENGYVASFNNGNLIHDFKNVKTGVISIDGESSKDVGELVLKDREMLSNNGIIIISATLDKKNKQILAGPEILSRGFVYVKDSTELMDNVKEICINIIYDNTYNNYIDYNKVKNTIRDNLSKYLFEQTGNKPMIITVLQEI